MSEVTPAVVVEKPVKSKPSKKPTVKAKAKPEKKAKPAKAEAKPKKDPASRASVRWTPEHREFLIGLYDKQDLVADNLAYTKQFDELHAEFKAKYGASYGKAEVFHWLRNLRKAGILTKKIRPNGRKRPAPVPSTEE